MWNVIYALFFREIKTRFGKNPRLGYAWVVGEPMFQLGAVLLVVTVIRNFQHFIIPGDISVFVFLAVGIIPFFMFRSILTQLIAGIEANLALFAYKPVKPIHVFIARTFLEVVVYLIIFVVLMLIAYWFFGIWVLPAFFLEVFLSFILVIWSGFSFGLCFAILVHLVPSTKVFVIYVSALFYVCSAIILPIWVVPKDILVVLYYNPLLHVFELLRHYYLENYPLHDDYTFIYPCVFNIVLLGVGLWFYYYKRHALVAVKRS